MKRLILIAGLLSLGVAFGHDGLTATSTKPSQVVDSGSADVSSRATIQMASIWVQHEEAISPKRLARPL